MKLFQVKEKTRFKVCLVVFRFRCMYDEGCASLSVCVCVWDISIDKMEMDKHFKSAAKKG